MTDAEFAVAMNIQDEPWGGLAIIANMAPEQRHAYELLSRVGDELNLWTTGVGPKPAGVIVFREHKKRR